MFVFGHRVLLLFFVASGLAAEFPTKTITVIFSYGLGSGSEIRLWVLTESNF